MTTDRNNHSHLRIVYLAICDIELVIGIVVEVVGVKISRDVLPPLHVHKASCKLTTTFALEIKKL